MPPAYLEAAGARLARREVAEGVSLQLNLHVAGHPGQLSGAEAAHRGQLQPKRVGETHSLAGVGAAAARHPNSAASGWRREGPATPTRSVSSGPGPEARPALAWLHLRLLLEAGPLAAVVGTLRQRGYEAQVARDVGAGGPLSRHGTPPPWRSPPAAPRRCSAFSRPTARRPRWSCPSRLRTLLAVTSRIPHLL